MDKHKRITHLLMLLTFIFYLPLHSNAADLGKRFTVGIYQFATIPEVDYTVAICGVTDLSLNKYEIPDTVTFNDTDYVVTEINAYYSNSIFCDCENLTDIILPPTLKKLSSKSFAGLEKLTDITLPPSITYIGYETFFNCKNLKSINIPDNVETIEHGAFWGCSSLTAITIPPSVTKLETRIFWECTNLTDVAINSPITSINEGTFYGCNNLRHVNIPKEVTSIGEKAFYECYNLEKVELPEGLITISSQAFYKCSSLEKIVIPDGVVGIGTWVFNECSNLTDVILSKQLKSIPTCTFRQCKKLTQISFPESINSIGNSAFSGTGLHELIIPDHITSLGDGAFDGCTQMVSAYVPASIKDIKEYTFRGCSVLKKLDIKGVEIFGNNACSDCTSLEELELPEGCVQVGWYAFSGATSLTKLTLPSTIKALIEHCFCDSELKEIHIKKQKPFFMGANFVSTNESTCILYVPIGTKTTYLQTEGWKNFKNIVEEGSEIPTTYQITYTLKHLTAPEAPTSIDSEIAKLEFTLNPESGYNLPKSITITMGDKTITADTDYIFDSITGKVTIPSITGNVVITATGVKEEIKETFYSITYQLQNLENAEAPDSIKEKGKLDITLSPFTNYKLPSSVNITMKGAVLNITSDYTYDSSTGKIIISSVTGDVVITAQAQSTTPPGGIYHKVSLVLNNLTTENVTDSIKDGEPLNLTFIVTDKDNFELPSEISVSMNGKILENNIDYLYDTGTGILKIQAVTDDIKITAQASPTLPVGTTFSNDKFRFKIIENIKDYVIVKNSNVEIIGIIGNAQNDYNLSSHVTYNNKSYAIVSIGNKAFLGCSNTTNIDLSAILNIGDEAFSGCTSIEKVTLSDSLCTLGNHLFLGCDNTLKEIHVKQKTPITISYTAFFDGDGLKTCKLYVPKGSKATYTNAPGWKEFKYILEEGEEIKETYSVTLNFTNISAPDAVSEVEQNAPFSIILIAGPGYECPASLTILMGGKTLKADSDYTYDSNTGKIDLQKVTGNLIITAEGTPIKPENPTFSAGYLNYKINNNKEVEVNSPIDNSLVKYTIPVTVKYENTTYKVTGISENAFRGCSKMSSIYMQEGLKTIGKGAFSNCSVLLQATIPASVESIGEGAFDGCPRLNNITVLTGNTHYASLNGALFNREKTILLVCPNQRGDIYTMPKSVVRIDQGAFRDCSNLSTLTLVEGLKEIGNEAFVGCTGLKKVTIPVSVTTIESNVFNNCDASLAEIHCLNATPIQINEHATFFGEGNGTNLCKLYVPKGSKAAYTKASGWNEFKQILEEGEEIQVPPLTPPTPESDITINSDSTYTDKDGNTGSFNGTIGSGSEETAINKLTINGSLSTTTTITLNRVTIGEGSSSTTETTTSVTQNTNVIIELQGDNSLGKLVNDGITQLMGEINATLRNTNVVNNGVFTDQTGLLTQVEGVAGLDISAPADQEVPTGKSVVLTASTEVSSTYSITFIWEQLQPDGTWKVVGTPNTYTPTRSGLRFTGNTVNDNLTVSAEEAGTYRCVINNKVDHVSTTLLTQPATVTVKSTVDNAVIDQDRKAYVRDRVLYIQVAVPTKIKVINFNGQIIKELQLPVGETRIDGLQQGFYIIQFNDDPTIKVSI